jgi:hypothetical protein
MKTTAYLSHAIRGKNRLNATEDEIQVNCKKAIKVGNYIRQHCPKLSLYVPAEHEEFVHLAYQTHILKEKQILDVDCGIISTKDFIIVAVWDGISSGMQTEIDHSNKHSVPIVMIKVRKDGTIAPKYLQRIDAKVIQFLVRKN